MNRRIGGWIQLGLFAALPLGGGVALAQSVSYTGTSTNQVPAGEPVPSDEVARPSTGENGVKPNDLPTDTNREPMNQHKDVNPPSTDVIPPPGPNPPLQDQKPIEQEK